MNEGTIIVIVILVWFIVGILPKLLSKRQSGGVTKVHDDKNNNSDEIEKKYYYKNGKDIVVINSLDEIKKLNSNKPVVEKKEEKNEEKRISNNPNYKLPTIDLLDIPKKSLSNTQEKIEKHISEIEKVFNVFKIKAKIVTATVGPIYTLFEVETSSDTKLSKISSLKREISAALMKEYVDIQAPIPGKKTCGITINNDEISTIYMRDVIGKIHEDKNSNKLFFPLGKDMYGNCICCDLKKENNILISGSTGSGKSVCIKSIITSILMNTKPCEVKLVLIDTKKVELSMYNGVPHLLRPVVTDPKKAAVILQKLVSEMEHRYDLFEENHLKNVDSYNEWVETENKNCQDKDKIEILPDIVVIIDELFDMSIVASKDVQDSIIRLAQMSRPTGIYMIISTQLPFESTLTKLIKSNISTRIAFSVPTSSDSRAFIDSNGAEDLIGHGDMLFMTKGEKKPKHILGTYVSDNEIDRINNYVCTQQKAQYDQRFLDLRTSEEILLDEKMRQEEEEEYDDPLYNDIVEFVVTTGKASASLLQRRFKLGYNRAAKAIDLLEERGIIGPMDGSKPREVLVKLNKNDDDDEAI